MSLVTPSRRRFLFGAGALLAAPSIVRVASLMPVSVPIIPKPFLIVNEFTAADLVLSVEQFNEKILRPQMIRLANNLDAAMREKIETTGWGWYQPPT